jgi:GH15 family glucan-1,4-alpha-glucosidase
MTNLFHRSIEIILKNQSPSGAYLAAPSFPTYRYSWFRDGSFIAYSMDIVGEHASARRFHDWAAMVVNQSEELICRAIEKAGQGESLESEDVLHTRYCSNGEPAQENWPNFQLDGFGSWLWSLAEHERLAKGGLSDECLHAARLVSDYLAALWQQPCYDCWEEFPDKIHAYTLAAIYGGIKAIDQLTEIDPGQDVNSIPAFIFKELYLDGHFVKFAGSEGVDANLLALAIPYAIVAADDIRMRATVRRIESALRKNGGVHRYAADTYYGGGEWILLTAWLGWYYSRIGERDKAESILAWVEAQADDQYNLPEQVCENLLFPEFFQDWENRWGPVANPLLWSHAMYLILSHELGAD